MYADIEMPRAPHDFAERNPSALKKIAKLLRILINRRYALALLRTGVAAAVEHAALLSRLGCRTIVDIGANRGQFSLVASESCPAARIIAFEPLPGPAQLFRRVFGRNNNVTLYESAIGIVSGAATMHVSARDDSSSMLEITDVQNSIFPGTAEASTQTINVTTLAEVIEPKAVLSPALLKLDVQGFELQALIGCETLLPEFSWIYAECSFLELYAGQALAHEIIRWLSEHHFNLVGIYNVTYTREGTAVQADFLFKRNDTAIVRRVQ